MEVRILPLSIVVEQYLTLLPSHSWDLHVTSSCHRIKLYSVNKSKPETAARLKQIADHGETFEPLTRPLEWSLEDTDEYLARMRKYPREPLD